MLIFCEIAIFIFGPFGLKLPIHSFGGYDKAPLGIGYRRKGSEETRMMGLPDGHRSFKIGLAILTQCWHVTDTQPSFRSKYHASKHHVGKNTTYWCASGDDDSTEALYILKVTSRSTASSFVSCCVKI